MSLKSRKSSTLFDAPHQHPHHPLKRPFRCACLHCLCPSNAQPGERQRLHGSVQRLAPLRQPRRLDFIKRRRGVTGRGGLLGAVASVGNLNVPVRRCYTIRGYFGCRKMFRLTSGRLRAIGVPSERLLGHRYHPTELGLPRIRYRVIGFEGSVSVPGVAEGQSLPPRTWHPCPLQCRAWLSWPHAADAERLKCGSVSHVRFCTD